MNFLGSKTQNSDEDARATVYAKTDINPRVNSIQDQIESIDADEFDKLLHNLQYSDLYFGGSQRIPEWLEQHLDTFKDGKVPSYAVCIHYLNINEDMR